MYNFIRYIILHVYNYKFLGAFMAGQNHVVQRVEKVRGKDLNGKVLVLDKTRVLPFE